MIFWLLILIVIGLVLWVRFSPNDPNVWHVDPQTAKITKKSNQYLMNDSDGASQSSLTVSTEASKLAMDFDAVAMGQSGVSRLAGKPADLWTTYVHRTKLMAYPDFISVRVTDIGGGQSKLSVFSRSRFGRSDLGVNKARVQAWIALLGQPEN